MSRLLRPGHLARGAVSRTILMIASVLRGSYRQHWSTLITTVYPTDTKVKAMKFGRNKFYHY